MSKANIDRIAKWVGGSKPRFDDLVKLFLTGEFVVTQRAAWVVQCCVETHPELAKPYIGKLIERACEPGVHQGVARNITGLLQFVDISKKDLGNAVNFCFNALVDKETPAAVQANAMTVLTNVCKREPDLKHELKTAIETLMVNGSAAVKARGKRSLAQLEKL